MPHRNNDQLAFFPTRLRTARLARGLSQPELAELIDRSANCISRWETRHRVPSIQDLRRLSLTLQVTSDYLIGLSMDATPRRIDSEQRK